ncbi:MAG: hypothetical protein ACOYI4_01875 [Christensenellales bacterium]
MKLDESTKLNAKYQNKQYIEKTSAKLIQYFADSHNKIRTKEKHLCRYCYYVNTSRIGGAMITTVICANCDKELTFPSTSVDILCDECAQKLGSCHISEIGKKLFWSKEEVV